MLHPGEHPAVAQTGAFVSPFRLYIRSAICNPQLIILSDGTVSASPGMVACNPATGSNTVRLFMMVTDFRPEYNPDFGGDGIPTALADPGIVAEALDASLSPSYGAGGGKTATTTGAKQICSACLSRTCAQSARWHDGKP